MLFENLNGEGAFLESAGAHNYKVKSYVIISMGGWWHGAGQ